MKKKNFKKAMGYSINIGAAALIGGKLPTVAGAPVKAVATAGAPFVAPIVSVTGAGMVFNTLKKINPKKRKGR